MIISAAQQRTEEWFNLRKGVPSCSRFDQIITPKTGKPSEAQDKLINELIAESLLPPEQGLIRSSYMSPEMEQGVILEAEARCCYELEHAKGKVTEAGFILHDSGLFGGSPDALVGDDGGVEIKCPALSTHIGYVRDGELPSKYKCQVHGYMVVTGRAHWDFFSYTRTVAPFRLRVLRDDFTDKLEEVLLDFCQRYNQARKLFNLPELGAKL